MGGTVVGGAVVGRVPGEGTVVEGAVMRCRGDQ